VPARLAALRHDDVRADFQGTACLLERLHLVNERNICLVNGFRECAWITERQHDRRRLPRQRHVEQLGITGEAPGDEPGSDPCPLRLVELALQPSRIAVAPADQSQAAGRRHGRGEPPPGYFGHRCKQDRVFDPEEFCETGCQRHDWAHFSSPVRNCARPWPKDQSSSPFSVIETIRSAGSSPHRSSR